MKVADYRTAEDVTDDAALKSIALLLDDAAMAWWHISRDTIATWADFEAAFRKRFLPKIYDYKVTEQINNRFQTASENISEYVVIIRSMYQRMARPPEEEEHVQHIFENLRPEYKNHMKDDIVTFDELCERGRRAEVLMEGIKRYKTAHHKKADDSSKPSTSKGAKLKTPDGKKAATPTTAAAKPARPRCNYCQIPGHTEDVCNKKKRALAAASSSSTSQVPAKPVNMV